MKNLYGSEMARRAEAARMQKYFAEKGLVVHDFPTPTVHEQTCAKVQDNAQVAEWEGREVCACDCGMETV